MGKTRASRRSQMSHQFSMVPQAKIPRSSFDRSHGYKTTVSAGLLQPIYLDEVLPGDTHSVRASLFGRLATPIKPVMDNIFMDTFFFFVPTRLVWDNWHKFNGAQDAPGDSTDYTIPTITYDGTESNVFEALADAFGLPVNDEVARTVNALPFRCYSLIFNEWFRDQNLVSPLTVVTDDGPELPSRFSIKRRRKRHDYFTSCLPWPQKGDPVTVPLGQYAPVVSDTVIGGTGQLDTTHGLLVSGGTGSTPPGDATFQTPLPTGGPVQWTDPGLVADLASATGFTINQLRQSFQIQKLLERDARGGTRYIEIIRSHFGVISPDARLQRPEFLGGGTSMVNINPIAQTGATIIDGTGASGTIAETAQGNLAAFGTVSAGGHGFTKSFTEHGYIIGLVNFRADLTYQQGIERLWSREGRYDFYWPSLAHIGEQAVLNKEIYSDGSANDDLVFGYQERYGEYRYKPSRITGRFRSSYPQPLDFWHLAQDFDSLPVLGETFINDSPPFDRILAVPDEPDFLLDVYYRVRSVRPMPLYGVPGLIDHF